MRMQQFDKDVLHWVDYDFVVINEDLDLCYNEIINYIKNKKIKYDKSYDKKSKNILKSLLNYKFSYSLAICKKYQGV